MGCRPACSQFNHLSFSEKINLSGRRMTRTSSTPSISGSLWFGNSHKHAAAGMGVRRTCRPSRLSAGPGTIQRLLSILFFGLTHVKGMHAFVVHPVARSCPGKALCRQTKKDGKCPEVSGPFGQNPLQVSYRTRFVNSVDVLEAGTCGRRSVGCTIAYRPCRYPAAWAETHPKTRRGQPHRQVKGGRDKKTPTRSLRHPPSCACQRACRFTPPAGTHIERARTRALRGPTTLRQRTPTLRRQPPPRSGRAG